MGNANEFFPAFARALAMGSSPWKEGCRVVSTTNLLLRGEQTVDGVALGARDSILVAGQTQSAKNGVYLVQTGEWTRREDVKAGCTLLGMRIPILEGSYAGSSWALTSPRSGAIVLDSTTLTFTLDPNTGGGVPGGIVLVGTTAETNLTGPVIKGARHFAPGPGVARFRAVLQATTGMTARARLLNAAGTVLATLMSTSVAVPEMKEAVLAALPGAAAIYIVDLTISVGSPTVNDRAIVHSAVVDFN